MRFDQSAGDNTFLSKQDHNDSMSSETLSNNKA